MVEFCMSLMADGVRFGFVVGLSCFVLFLALGSAVRFLYNVLSKD